MVEVLLLLSLVIIISGFWLYIVDINHQLISYKKQKIINYALYNKNVIYGEREINKIIISEKITSQEELKKCLKYKYNTLNLPDFKLRYDIYSEMLYLEDMKGTKDVKYYKPIYLNNKVTLNEFFF